MFLAPVESKRRIFGDEDKERKGKFERKKKEKAALGKLRKERKMERDLEGKE